MTRRYTIDVSEEQLGVITRALDVYARIGMGQLEVAVYETVRDLFWKASDTETVWSLVRTHLNEVKVYVWGHPPNGSYGIFSRDVPAECREAYDILQVCRKVRAEARGTGEWSVDRRDYMPAHPEWPPVLCTVYDPAPAPKADPMPTPGPSSVVAQAAGEGGAGLSSGDDNGC